MTFCEEPSLLLDKHAKITNIGKMSFFSISLIISILVSCFEHASFQNIIPDSSKMTRVGSSKSALSKDTEHASVAPSQKGYPLKRH